MKILVHHVQVDNIKQVILDVLIVQVKLQVVLLVQVIQIFQHHVQMQQ